MSGRTILGMLCCILALGISAQGFAGVISVIQVPGDQPTIQAAVTAAISGDEIHVAPGTYFENVDLQGKAILLLGTGGRDVTTIDGSFLTRGVGEGSTLICQSGETSTTVIDGFTITNGTGRLESVVDAGGSPLGNFRVGGGLLAISASPRVQNCTFIGNQAQLGSGVYYQSAADATIVNCLFTGNSGIQGSGAYLRLLTNIASIANCQFVGNSASTAGGGVMIENASTVISNSSFDGNDAILGGGAVLQDSAVLFTGTTFTGNDATLLGGGALVFDATVTLEECRFIANTGGTGAGIGCDFGTATLRRCLLASNQASGDGGAIALSNNPATLALENCTLTSNSSPTSGGIFIPASAPSTASVTNSIVRGNSGAPILDGGQTTVSFSNVEGPPAGTGNLDIDPEFVAPLAGDFTLLPTSPMIDAGDPAAPAEADGTALDIGAFFFDQRPDQIGPIDCTLLDLCDSSFTVSWTVADFYDTIEVTVDGLLVETLPGTQQSATVSVGSEGPHQVCLTPTFAGLVGPESCCQANAPTIPAPLPVSGLNCLVDEGSCSALVTWVNEDAYAGIEILVDGITFITLSGTSVAMVVPVANGALSEITVTGTATCGGVPIPPQTCLAGCNIDFEPFQRGDANADGGLDISDPLTVLILLFGSGAPLACEDAGDANDDGLLDIADAVSLIDAIFGLGPQPGAPGLGACATDPTANDPLNCASYSPCAPI